MASADRETTSTVALVERDGGFVAVDDRTGVSGRGVTRPDALGDLADALDA